MEEWTGWGPERVQPEVGRITDDGWWLLDVSRLAARRRSQGRLDLSHGPFDGRGYITFYQRAAQCFQDRCQLGFRQNRFQRIACRQAYFLAKRVDDDQQSKIISSRDLASLKSAMIDKPKTQIRQCQCIRQSTDISSHEALWKVTLKVVQHRLQMTRLTKP